MRINIIIDDGNKNETDDFGLTSTIAANIHNIFAGNKDYIESAILLNFEGAGPAVNQCPDQSSINMIFAINECEEKKKALFLLQSAIVEVVDGIMSTGCCCDDKSECEVIKKYDIH